MIRVQSVISMHHIPEGQLFRAHMNLPRSHSTSASERSQERSIAPSVLLGLRLPKLYHFQVLGVAQGHKIAKLGYLPNCLARVSLMPDCGMEAMVPNLSLTNTVQ